MALLLNKHDVVKAIVGNRPLDPVGEATAFAPSNIALCKYWGKRDELLNLPVTSSVSVSLGALGTTTTIKRGSEQDRVVLNGTEVDPGDVFAERISRFLDPLRKDDDTHFEVLTENNIPTAAGLASSASGYAALALALNGLFNLQLDPKSLSILARLGSGSASRSLFEGFVEWHAGAQVDGMDSYAERLDETWPDLRLGLLTLSDKKKPIDSRAAMKRTVETSTLYKAWPVKVAHDLMQIKAALREHDFKRLGETAESNALTMHATMLGSTPSVLYWLPESVEAIHRIWALRKEGLDLFFTMDAGPNIKLLFLAHDADSVEKEFPDMQLVVPFA